MPHHSGGASRVDPFIAYCPSPYALCPMPLGLDPRPGWKTQDRADMQLQRCVQQDLFPLVLEIPRDCTLVCTS